MNRRIYSVIFAALVCVAFGLLTSCGGGSHTTPPPTIAITAQSGGGQSIAVNTQFASPLVAYVTSNGTAASGITVTFTPPASGASCTPSSGTASTGASGTAQIMCTANGTAGGPYNVTATATGATGSATFALTNNPGPAASISATAGTPQSATVGAAFATQLQAIVLDASSNPVPNATVTFTAPGTEPNGNFAGAATTTAQTNASGQASVTATAGTLVGTYNVTAAVSGVATPANYTLTNNAGAAATITATSGTPQGTAINTPFLSPLVATVVDTYSNPVPNATVTFAAPATGASATFAGGVNTATTNASGVATSQTLTADATPGSFTVAATVTGVATPADYSLTNGIDYVFAVSGLEVPSAINSGTHNYYALVGSVIIDPSGNVIRGEQDYNDGAFILTNQSLPNGDIIQPALNALVVNASGQGTLTLTTHDQYVGVNGVETLAVQFVNSAHALITEFDSSATSSGTMDMQTTTIAQDGNYAFALSGVDTNYDAVDYGGVFSLASGFITGTADTNDFGNVAPGSSMSGMLAGTDPLGRGTTVTNGGVAININGTALNCNYYVVGPEVIRFIDVEIYSNALGTGAAALGSAYGQGSSTTFSSLGDSVFGLEQADPVYYWYSAAGQFATTPGSTTFSGYGDEDQQGALRIQAISGSYTLSSTTNGYGSLTVTAGLGQISNVGVYMIDPNLNLLDPNNLGGLPGGGALLADMDAAPAPYDGGVGYLIPQTSTADISGNTYAFGAQDYWGIGEEFDFVGQGSVATGDVLTGTGVVSDPEGDFNAGTGGDYSNVPFAGTAVADPINVGIGRYTMVPLNVTINATVNPFSMVLYEANPSQLIWMDEDTGSLSLGTLQQQGSLTEMPAAKKPLAKTQTKHKH